MIKPDGPEGKSKSVQMSTLHDSMPRTDQLINYGFSQAYTN